jgi:hypothetical protein
VCPHQRVRSSSSSSSSSSSRLNRPCAQRSAQQQDSLECHPGFRIPCNSSLLLLCEHPLHLSGCSCSTQHKLCSVLTRLKVHACQRIHRLLPRLFVCRLQAHGKLQGLNREAHVPACELLRSCVAQHCSDSAHMLAGHTALEQLIHLESWQAQCLALLLHEVCRRFAGLRVSIESSRQRSCCASLTQCLLLCCRLPSWE